MIFLLRESLPHFSIRFSKSLVLAIILAGPALHLCAQSDRLSKKEMRSAGIDSVFSKAEADSLNTMGLLRYEYYFSNSSKGQLEKLGKKLEKDSFETILLDSKDPNNWKMVIMKDEILSRQDMLRRDKRMRGKAYQYIIDRYEGFTISTVRANPMKIPEEKFVSFITSLDNETVFASANYLLSKKAYDRSMVAFQESINRHHKEDTSQYQMGNALVATNKLVKGIERWEAARNLNPKYLHAYLKLGKIFYENSHFNRALYNFEKANALDPDNDQILYQIAETLYQLGRYNDSYEYALRAVSINRKNVFAKSMLDLLEQPGIKKLRKESSEK